MYIYILDARRGLKPPPCSKSRIPEFPNPRVLESQIPRGAKAPSWNCELDVKVGAKDPTLTRVAAF